MPILKLCIKDTALDSRYAKPLYEKLVEKRESLTRIELNDNMMVQRVEPDVLLPKVHTLIVRLTPGIEADLDSHKISADWQGIESLLMMLKVWLSKVQCPALKVLELRWRTYTLMNTRKRGVLEKYDKDGPVYDTDYENALEKLSFDQCVEVFQWKSTKTFDWNWIVERYPQFKTLVLPYSLFLSTPSYPFEILDEFDEQDREDFLHTLHPYWPFTQRIKAL